jgi:tRNA (Thr-GGU) A37 N-methylase
MKCPPIGTVSSPPTEPDEAPRQGAFEAIEGRVELFAEYAAGLAGFDVLDGTPVVNLKPPVHSDRE